MKLRDVGKLGMMQRTANFCWKNRKVRVQIPLPDLPVPLPCPLPHECLLIYSSRGEVTRGQRPCLQHFVFPVPHSHLEHSWNMESASELAGTTGKNME